MSKMLEKRIKKQMSQKGGSPKGSNKMPIIFGAILLVIAACVVAGFTLNKSYDTAQTTTTNLYANEISFDSMQQKVAANQDFYAWFYQPDCVHCEAMSPFVIPLAKSMHKALFPVNIKGKQNIWDMYHVHGTPTLIHFKNGKEVGRIDGERPEMEYSNFFTQ